ncbi:MAG: hypothetical protein D084_Lepto4C00408G0003 [Leptospirillum sp. Group IV 'UBA BS']|nr:MAG: hypothetical protein D084_Lepto4C00408G0003 [Leptospirillum sp. Group IV 'UBA BS']MCL5284599.1 proteasome subunit beta [Nitrospirota bacterium]
MNWKSSAPFVQPFDSPSFLDCLRSSGYWDQSPLPGGHSPGIGSLPHATTVLAVRYAGGVVMAGDRQASEGYQVSSRAISKVIPVDRFSCVAIAGAAGPAIDMARLFRVEIEHYEKLEGVMLTTDGKANKLAQMVREALPMAMQGLVVVPLFAGYDVGRGAGRIYKYDPAGGRYEEDAYHANGSGGLFARNALKMLWKEGLDRNRAIEAALRALYEAADEDLGTGGPDFVREIYPSVFTMDREGTIELPAAEVALYYRNLVDSLKRKD